MIQNLYEMIFDCWGYLQKDNSYSYIIGEEIKDDTDQYSL